MKKIEFKTEIAAKPEKVWKTMLEQKTYREWVNAGWPGSTYEGTWKEGETIRFVGESGQGGTAAKLEKVREPESIFARHIAVITPDGGLDTSSEEAKGWVGTTEEYALTEKNGKTELKVIIHTAPQWESMFNEGWPAALNKLKEICERKTVPA